MLLRGIEKIGPSEKQERNVPDCEKVNLVISNHFSDLKTLAFFVIDLLIIFKRLLSLVDEECFTTLT